MSEVVSLYFSNSLKWQNCIKMKTDSFYMNQLEPDELLQILVFNKHKTIWLGSLKFGGQTIQ